MVDQTKRFVLSFFSFSIGGRRVACAERNCQGNGDPVAVVVVMSTQKKERNRSSSLTGDRLVGRVQQQPNEV